ncbi:MAG TPA: class I SAM-dependent methyltransferase [Blastocatellia bacterium]|nr:class I SAM-dependent methyltransferase [Blastocatellia bacterium]HMV83044.1 class I SAM-dependent methyltransferase [Blastocatellia bacterium]HMX27989.1 class I SAM-dependent methyltransferase [Blastocatellia bacterium]HMY71774.1 class I SAM-dependent methyltransferase [Blastocatellia bacterium]HMZ17767.1 class I SAM-dependent methyltransferase [Blastocatellia bacterium]
MNSKTQAANRDAKEQAYIYDLYVVPTWREVFDKLVDEEIELPKEGRFLEVECGTGGYAIDLAVRGGGKVKVVGVDSSEERLALARGKAEVQHVSRATFQQAPPEDLDFTVGEFDLAIGDFSLLPPDRIESALEELIRVTKKGATVAVKLATHGSFGEVFSLYWEALYELNLIEYSPQLEGLMSGWLTAGKVEELALDSGLRSVRSVTHKERMDFADGQTFLSSPLIETIFLDDWLAFLPDEKTRLDARQQLVAIIDRERQNADFDVSIKATILIGQK